MWRAVWSSRSAQDASSSCALTSLKRAYGKSLSNFPPCVFGGSSPAPPRLLRVAGRGRSGGLIDEHGDTGLIGASLGGGGVCVIDQGGTGGQGGDHDNGLINADQGGEGHRRNGLDTIGRGGAGRRGEHLHLLEAKWRAMVANAAVEKAEALPSGLPKRRKSISTALY
ncbi:hypothetical protein PI124_g12627 [Phytophthora idaei]|nr:hypothetical protein PI125_g6868 [Phytophthora idaei]KAG3242559.1 hypothetical protein PI124_g12627 [Phytophthora idaei]